MANLHNQDRCWEDKGDIGVGVCLGMVLWLVFPIS